MSGGGVSIFVDIFNAVSFVFGLVGNLFGGLFGGGGSSAPSPATPMMANALGPRNVGYQTNSYGFKGSGHCGFAATGCDDSGNPLQSTSNPANDAKGAANEIGILRSAAKGKGNFNLGSANTSTAVRLGRSWVGEGYKVSRDGKALVSRDGLRQFRPPSEKPNSPYATTGTQANFEWRNIPTGRWQGNGHLDITP